MTSNKMNLDFFQNWMGQPGQIKQLQLFLALSVLLLLFLSFQLLNTNMELSKLEKSFRRANLKSTAEVLKPQAADVVDAKAKEQVPKISEAELRDFIGNYMIKFFTITEEANVFVEEHTTEALFESSIKDELLNRKTQKINSKFKVKNLLLESVDATTAKAICFGREHFPKGDYEDRDFIIELLVDTAKLNVKAIPVFKIE